MRNFLFVFIALAVVLGLHWYLIAGNLYRVYWWVDIVMHGLGGALVAGFYFALRGRTYVWHAVAFILFVGVAWEVLEFIFDVPFLGVGEARWNDPIWQLDTIADLIVDVVAGTLLWRMLQRYTNT